MYILCRRLSEFKDAGCLFDMPQKIREVTFFMSNRAEMAELCSFSECTDKLTPV